MNTSQMKPKNDGNQDLNNTVRYELPILDTSSIGILISRISDGTVLYANKAIAGLLGIAAVDSVIGAQVSDFYWDMEDRKAILERLRTEGSITNNDLRTRRADGSMAWVSISIRPFNFEGEQALLSEIADITERKQAEEALRKNQSLYQSLVEVSPMSICRKDLAGRFTFANQRFLDVSQTTLADLVGKSDSDLHPSELADKYRRDDLAVMESGQVQELIEERMVQEGGTAYVQTIKAPIYDGTGKISGIQISFWDITDRKRAEEAIHASEERFRRFTEATVEGLVFHEQGKIVDVNPAAVAMFGLPNITDLIGRNLLEFIMPESHEMVLKQMQLESVLPYEIQCVRKDGTLFPVETSTRAYKEGGRIIRASSIRDITERKQADDKLKQNVNFTSALLDAIPTPVFYKDNKGKYQGCNRAFTDIMGVTSEEIKGKTVHQLWPSENAEIYHQKDMELMRKEEHQVYEATTKDKDGIIRPVIFAKDVFYDESGNVAGLVGAFLDITERKHAEQALQESQRLLQLVMDNIPQAVFWKDKELTYLGTNQAFAEDAGFNSPQDLVGKTDFDMPWKEQAELYRADDQRILELGEAKLNYEEPQTGPTGKVTWLRTSKIPMRDAAGKIFAVLGMYEDITESKITEQSLRESEQRFRSMAETMIDGLTIIEGNKVVYINNRFCEIIGYSEDELKVMSSLDYAAPEEKERLAQLAAQARQTGVPLTELAYWIVRKDGQRRYLHNRYSTLVTSDNQIKGRVIATTDETERIQLEQQIQEAFERRGYQVQISTEISQEVASASKLSDLFERVVTLTKERLGYYHTQLLRYDAAQDAVVLVNGYGETGQKMLADGHRMPMGAGLIGTAAASGETVLRPTLAEDPDWHPNPLLPETQGEIAVPIKFGEKTLGVLDVQSSQAGAITEDDRLLLEGLCGQIAVAIEQTRLRQEMAERLEEVNRLYQSMSHEGWQTYRQTTDLPAGFIYDQAGIRPVGDEVLADELFANIPMKVLGGETVGTLTVANDPHHPTSPDDYAFLQQVSDQIALALESARLFEQTQSALAQSERLFVASRSIAQVADLQELLKATVETLNIPVINRAGLELFSYNAAGELDRTTLAATWHAAWWNNAGQAPEAVGRSLTANALKLISFFMGSTPLFINDVDYDERVDPAAMQIAKSQNYRALAALPLFVGTQQIGAVTLTAEEPHNFTQDEIRLFTALAPQITTVLENRRQFERAQKQADRESTLNLISQKIQGATSVEAVLQIAARELGHALGAPRTIAQLSIKDKK